MEEWVGYYERVFGMTELIHFSDEAISTEYSALMSKVVTDGSGRLKFPINEPAEGKRKSQIEEYLDFYRGRRRAAHGDLHARHRRDRAARCARAACEFLADPRRRTTTRCPSRIGEIEQDLADLRRLGILVDRDDEGYLLQIFTKPLGDRPTSSSRSSSGTARAASARGTSRRSSRRSSASRTGGATCEVRAPRRRPAQAPRAGAAQRRGLAAAHRGGHGLRGLLGQRDDPLPPALALPARRGRRLQADRARRVGARHARPPPRRHAARWSPAATR